jgi:hypothetical protein
VRHAVAVISGTKAQRFLIIRRDHPPIIVKIIISQEAFLSTAPLERIRGFFEIEADFCEIGKKLYIK